MTGTYAFTREQLVDAIADLQVEDVLFSRPGEVVLAADRMADAIIAKLGGPDHLVHWHWPPSCMSELVRRDTWTGDSSRVTCPACTAAMAEEGSRP